MKKLRLIELFAGGGGVAAGAVEAGIEPVAAIEFDPNNPELSKEIANCHQLNFPNCQLVRRTVEDCMYDGYQGFRSCDILWASPVCSNYSEANLAGRETDADFDRAVGVIEALATFRPQYFYLENVTAYHHSKAWRHIRLLAEVG